MKICPACSREYPAERTHCERDGVGLVALTTGATGRAEDLIGRTVDGRYLIEAIIGRGGMGTVYSCKHVVVGKPFAMKVLRPGTEQTGDVLQRFIREAQTANSVRSRHIAEMTDFGQLSTGQFYMTMELLEGMDLGKALKQGLSIPQMLHIFIQCADVLELTHQRGIIHRDLKPDNVFLVKEDNDPHFVKLLDFGIAKALNEGAPSGLTETGVVLGTPYYMSPEQARGGQLDHRTDIYSLGVIMYRAFTGKLPFIADSAVGVLTRHLTEAPELPSRVGGCEPFTERLIMTCLEKRPEGRFASMAAVASALRFIQAGPRNAGSAPSLSGSGAVPAHGDPRAQHPHTGGHPAYAAGQAPPNSPYAPPPALNASQQGAAVSGPYAQQGAAMGGSGPYPQGGAMSGSGPYPQGGAMSGSGPHAQGAAMSGPYAQQGLAASQQGAAVQSPYGPPPALSTSQQGPAVSSRYAPPPALGASQQGPAVSGPYAQQPGMSASQQGAPVNPPYGPPSGQAQGGPMSQGQAPMSGRAAGSGGADPAWQGTGASAPVGAEWTAHGLAASQAMKVPAPRKKWPIIVGAFAMIAIGAVLAFTFGGKARSTGDATAVGGTAAPQATTTSAATTAPAATDAPAASSGGAAGASATPSGAPAASGAPSAAASGGSGAGVKSTGAVPKPTATPKATASASAATTTTKRPEIRSPFD